MLFRIASHLAQAPVTAEELFSREELLGRALQYDRSLTTGRQVSGWTVANRRAALRGFVTLMRPELERLLGGDPHAALDRALRGVAELVGTGYRLSGGTLRRRGGYVPTREDIAAVVTVSSKVPGFAGLRNRAFFGIMRDTGARVNALRELDGRDCVAAPGGAVRVFLREKGKRDRREVQLGAAAAAALRDYCAAYNRASLAQGWHSRVGVGVAGPLWRNSGRGRWPYRAVLLSLAHACAAAGVAPFTPHAFRRSYATEAASTLPRHVVALAGNWRGLERLDNHYVSPRRRTIWQKLETTQRVGGRMAESVADPSDHGAGAAVPVLR